MSDRTKRDVRTDVIAMLIQELEAKVTRITSRGFEDLNHENEQLKAKLKRVEGLKAKTEDSYAELWCPIEDGKPDSDLLCIGLVRNMLWDELSAAYEDLKEEVVEMGMEIPDGAYGVVLHLKGMEWRPGQMSFPETCQWDFPPHYEFDIEIVRFDKQMKTGE